MSAEAWRRMGTDLAPLDLAGVTLSARQARFAWQAWHLQYLHRCPRKLGDEWGRIWRRWILRGRFQHLKLDLRGRRDTFGTSIKDVSGSLATNGDGFGAAGSCVAGVTLAANQAPFAWQAWHFRYLHRCQRKLGDEWGRIWRRWILRGMRGTCSTSGPFAWQAWHFRYLHRCQRKLGDEWGRIWRRWILRGRRGTCST